MLLSNHSMAQLKFYANVSDVDVYRDDQITYSLILENASKPDSVTSVSFKDFLLISGPMESWGYAGYNGDVNNYFTFNFILKPKKSGKLLIPPSCIAVKGKIYKSNAVTIHVKKEKRSGNAPTVVTNYMGSGRKNDFKTEDHFLKRGENAEAKIREQMMLKMDLSKRSCYVGEPVVVAYKLYTKLRCDKKIIKTPSYNGFSVQDMIVPEMDYEREKLNGKEYNVYYVRKSQLYPLQPGEIMVDSAEVETLTDLINEDSRFANKDEALQFLDAFGPASLEPGDITTVNLRFNCRSSSLLVKPLPEKNKPASFKGAVGNFSIRAVVKQPSIGTDETGYLALNIKGDGNLQMITPPDIPWPQHIEPFDSKTFDQVDNQSIPLSGSRTFEYPFSCDSTGSYIIPSIQFSYFDPQKESYAVIQTEPLRIDVHQASHKPAVASEPVQAKAMLDGFIEKRGWIIFIIALLIVIGLILYVTISSKKHKAALKISVSEIDSPQPVRIMYSNPQNPFESSESCMHNDDCMQFYKFLQTDLYCFLADKLEIEPSEVTPVAIDKYLEHKNIPNEYALELKKLLDEIERQLYTPFERNEKIFEMYSKTQSITQHLNQYC